MIKEIAKGECFGEIALLYPNQARNSTVITKTIVEVYSLTDHDFKDLLGKFLVFLIFFFLSNIALIYFRPPSSLLPSSSLLHLFFIFHRTVGFPAFAMEMKTVSQNRIGELNRMASDKGGSSVPLITIPENNQATALTTMTTTTTVATTKFSETMHAPSTTEERLNELQAGITNILHHLRLIGRKA